MKFFFGNFSLLAVTWILLALEKEFALAANGNLQGSAASHTAGVSAGAAAAPAVVAPAPLEAGLAHGLAEEGLAQPAHHAVQEDNVVDISVFEGQVGVNCKVFNLLDDATMYVFTPSAGTDFTAIASSNLTVVKRQSDVTYPAVARIHSEAVDYVMAQANDGGLLHAQERVMFFKKSAGGSGYRTAFGGDILNFMYKHCKKVTYYIGEENSTDDFEVYTDKDLGTSHAFPHPNVFVERIMYKNQVIFQYSTSEAQTVSGIYVSTIPHLRLELTLLNPLVGFQFTIFYDVDAQGKLHSPSQASKTIAAPEVCPECEAEKAGAAQLGDKEEAGAKESAFSLTSGLVTLAVPFLMMMTIA